MSKLSKEQLDAGVAALKEVITDLAINPDEYVSVIYNAMKDARKKVLKDDVS